MGIYKAMNALKIYYSMCVYKCVCDYYYHHPSLKLDFCGRVKVFAPSHRGTLSETSVQVPHVFRKFPCTSPVALPLSRLQYFIEQVNTYLTFAEDVITKNTAGLTEI